MEKSEARAPGPEAVPSAAEGLPKARNERAGKGSRSDGQRAGKGESLANGQSGGDGAAESVSGGRSRRRRRGPKTGGGEDGGGGDGVVEVGPAPAKSKAQARVPGGEAGEGDGAASEAPDGAKRESASARRRARGARGNRRRDEGAAGGAGGDGAAVTGEGGPAGPTAPATAGAGDEVAPGRPRRVVVVASGPGAAERRPESSRGKEGRRGKGAPAGQAPEGPAGAGEAAGGGGKAPAANAADGVATRPAKGKAANRPGEAGAAGAGEQGVGVGKADDGQPGQGQGQGRGRGSRQREAQGGRGGQGRAADVAQAPKQGRAPGAPRPTSAADNGAGGKAPANGPAAGGTQQLGPQQPGPQRPRPPRPGKGKGAGAEVASVAPARVAKAGGPAGREGPRESIRVCTREEWTLRHAVAGADPHGLLILGWREERALVPGGRPLSSPRGPAEGLLRWLDASLLKLPHAPPGLVNVKPDALRQLAWAEWMRAPSRQTPAFTEALIQGATRDLLSPTIAKSRDVIVDRVGEIALQASSSLPELTARVEAFGSHIQETASASSDLDLTLIGTMVIDGGDAANDEVVELHQLQKEDKCRVLRKMRNLMRKYPEFRNVQSILGARVPVLKFVHAPTNVECDLSVGNRALLKCQVMRDICHLDPRIKPFVMAVKKWAGGMGINDSTRGTLSTFSLGLLALFHLQTRRIPIVPPLCELFYDAPGGHGQALALPRPLEAAQTRSQERELVAQCLSRILAPRDSGAPQANRETVGELFESFLVETLAVVVAAAERAAYAGPKVPPAMDVWTGRWVNESNGTVWKNAIGILDPFEPNENPSRTVNSFESMRAVLTAFRRSVNYLACEKGPYTEETARTLLQGQLAHTAERLAEGTPESSHAAPLPPAAPASAPSAPVSFVPPAPAPTPVSFAPPRPGAVGISSTHSMQGHLQAAAAAAAAAAASAGAVLGMPTSQAFLTISQAPVLSQPPSHGTSPLSLPLASVPTLPAGSLGMSPLTMPNPFAGMYTGSLAVSASVTSIPDMQLSNPTLDSVLDAIRTQQVEGPGMVVYPGQRVVRVGRVRGELVPWDLVQQAMLQMGPLGMTTAASTGQVAAGVAPRAVTGPLLPGASAPAPATASATLPGAPPQQTVPGSINDVLQQLAAGGDAIGRDDLGGQAPQGLAEELEAISRQLALTPGFALGQKRGPSEVRDGVRGSSAVEAPPGLPARESRAEGAASHAPGGGVAAGPPGQGRRGGIRLLRRGEDPPPAPAEPPAAQEEDYPALAGPPGGPAGDDRGRGDSRPHMAGLGVVRAPGRFVPPHARRATGRPAQGDADGADGADAAAESPGGGAAAPARPEPPRGEVRGPSGGPPPAVTGGSQPAPGTEASAPSGEAPRGPEVPAPPPRVPPPPPPPPPPRNPFAAGRGAGTGTGRGAPGAPPVESTRWSDMVEAEEAMQASMARWGGAGAGRGAGAPPPPSALYGGKMYGAYRDPAGGWGDAGRGPNMDDGFPALGGVGRTGERPTWGAKETEPRYEEAFPQLAGQKEGGASDSSRPSDKEVPARDEGRRESKPQWGSYAVASKLAGGAKSQVGSAMVSLGSVGKKKQTDASAA